MGRRSGGRVNLRKGVASVPYLRGQEKGIARFEAFLDRRGVVWDAWCSDDVDIIDDMLADWVQHEFDAQRTLFDTTCGVLAAQRRYRLQYRLPEAWNAIRTWRRARPSRRRRPLSPFLWKAIVLGLLSRAGHRGADAWLWVGTAVLVLVGFAGLEEVIKAKGGAGELAGVKLNKID